MTSVDLLRNREARVLVKTESAAGERTEMSQHIRLPANNTIRYV